MADRPTTQQEIAERLAEAIRRSGRSALSVSTEAGIPNSTFNTWVRGHASATAEGIAAIAAVLKISADRLLGLPERETAAEIEKEGEKITLLPRVLGRVGAGPARVDVPSKPLRYAFRTDWFRRRGLDPKRLVTCIVAKHGGDSMEPLIRPDSLLIVDLGPNREGIAELTAHDEGKVFVVKHPDEDGMKVKRVYRSGDQLIFWSDNPTASPRVEAVDLKGRSLHKILLGRVVWVGRDED